MEINEKMNKEMETLLKKIEEDNRSNKPIKPMKSATTNRGLVVLTNRNWDAKKIALWLNNSENGDYAFPVKETVEEGA